MQKSSAIALTGATAFLFALAAVKLLPTQLWIDEFSALHDIRGTLPQLIDNYLEMGQHSPVFSVIIWAVTQLLGYSEAAMRLVPFCAAMATLLVIQRLWSRHLSDEFAWCCLLLLAGSTAFLEAAFYVRPYSMGLLLCALAFKNLLDWWSSRREALLLIALCECALALHFHVIYGNFGLAVGLFLLAAVADRQLRWRELLLPVAAASAIAAPLLPLLMRLAQGSGWMDYTTPPTFAHLSKILLPPEFVILLVIIFAAAAMRHFEHSQAGRLAPAALHVRRLALLVYLFVPMANFMAHVFAGNSIVLQRHLLPYTLGLSYAVCASVFFLLPGANQARLRLLTCLLFAFTTVGLFALTRDPPGADWRAMSKELRTIQVRDDEAVFVRVGYQESIVPLVLKDAVLRERLLQIAHYYGLPGRLQVFPKAPYLPEVRQYMSQLLEDVSGHCRVLIAQEEESDCINAWIIQHMATAGFDRSDSIEFRGYGHILVFNRSSCS